MPAHGENHHCMLCNKTSKQKSNKNGIYTKHQEFCPRHEFWFFYKGEKCTKCEEEERRKENEERKERERKAELARADVRNAFCKDDSKEKRKQKVADKKNKKSKGGNNR